MEQLNKTDSGILRSEDFKLEEFEKNSAMLLSTYEALAMRTAKDFQVARLNMAHAGMGIASDAGEACGAMKAHAVYGKDLDAVHDEKTGQTLRENIIEELGDTLWFIVLGARCVGVSLEEVARRNVEKLRKRYPGKYSDADAIARADKKV